MKTIEITGYEYSDLLKPENEEIKDAVLNKHYDINVDHNWWDFTYDDAKEIGLKINGFSLDRDYNIEYDNYYSLTESAELILKNHGETCDTYKIAKSYISQWVELVKEYSDGENINVVTEENEVDFDNDADYLEKEYFEELANEYLSMLNNECEYLMTEAAILETIESNEYVFNEYGEIIG